MDWLGLVTTLAVTLVSAAYSRYYLHMFQLESYQTDGYQRWLGKNRDKLLGWTLNLGVLATVFAVLAQLIFGMLLKPQTARLVSTLLAIAGFVAGAWVLNIRQYKTPEKKPFVLTARMKRLWAALFVIALLLSALLSFLGIPVFLAFVAVPYLTLAAGFVMQPIEKKINAYYLHDAQKKLEARPDLIRVGITGSYGKTSTKFILQAILQEKWRVLASPASFNTPMGLTRVIREQLRPEHQVFLAEMGARHVGDIKELTDLVHPQYGVITSVGAQHLETFGNVETVASAKFELIEALPEDGVAFFAADGGLCDELFKRATCEKYRAGLTGGFLNMYAQEIQAGPEGSRFVLCDSQGGRVPCRTKLLGRHNIQNIVLCAMVAKRLGMSLEEIARGISRAQPVEHRLQLIPGANGITVIDDAFNANPVGAAAALEVLRDFPGRRVIVTPGLVEQGDKEVQFNYDFGLQMAQSCDAAILVGKKRSQPIYKGALEGGMTRDQVMVVANLDEATAVLGQIGKPGDVVLFENDLPDNYSE